MPVDNSAGVQVGLALLLVALVIASTLLVIGIIASAIGRVGDIGDRFDRLAASLTTEHTALEKRFTVAQDMLAQASCRLSDAERRPGTQEPE